MKLNVVLALAVLAVLIGGEIVMGMMTKHYLNRLSDLLMAQKFAEFDALMNKKIVKILLPGFNYEYINLNRYLAEGNDTKVNECFETFKKRNLNREQKKAVYTQGFNYAVIKKNDEQIKYYHDELVKLPNLGDEVATVERVYAILVKKDMAVLEQIVKETESETGLKKVENQVFLSQVYTYLGNDRKAREYIDAAMETQKQLKKEEQ